MQAWVEKCKLILRTSSKPNTTYSSKKLYNGVGNGSTWLEIELDI